MSKATLPRPCKLEVKARLDGSLQNMTDAQLFGACRHLIERGGGDDAFSAFLKAEGDGQLAYCVLALEACPTAAAFMALEH